MGGGRDGRRREAGQRYFRETGRLRVGGREEERQGGSQEGEVADASLGRLQMRPMSIPALHFAGEGRGKVPCQTSPLT